MIGLIPIRVLLELAVWASAVAHEDNPPSILLVAKPESGKSSLISNLNHSHYTKVITDATAWGLANEVVLPMIRDRIEVRLLLIPDLMTPLARGRDSAASFLAIMQALMEEGVGDIYTKFTHLKDLDRAIRGGIITSITPWEFRVRQKRWVNDGFLSRFLVLSYDHAESTQADVLEAIRTTASTFKGNPTFRKLPLQRIPVKTDPALFKPITDFLPQYLAAVGLTNSAYGYRVQEHLQRLAMGSALERGSDTLSVADVTKVLGIVEIYGNLRFNIA